MSILGLFAKRATIERALATTGPAGEVTLQWSQVASAVPCALQPLKVKEKLSLAGETLLAEARLFLPAGTDLRPRLGGGLPDRVTVDAVTYRVAGASKDVLGGEILMVATLVREA